MLDEKTLEKFLIHSKNSLERAKSKLDKYYSARATVADMFHDRDPLQTAISDIAQVAWVIHTVPFSESKFGKKQHQRKLIGFRIALYYVFSFYLIGSFEFVHSVPYI